MLIDTHSHFDDSSFDHDRPLAWARAVQAGVSGQIVPAISAAHWPRLRAVCAAYPQLYPAYGLHPMYLAEHRAADLETLAVWLEQEPAVAVGECGLDFFVPGLDVAAQTQFFTRQLALAHDLHLPVILHARRAVDAVLQQLRRYPGLRGVVHSFAGSEQQARQLIDLGFYLSVGGPLTYPRAQRLQRLVTVLPLEFLLLETDAPDQPLSNRRGQRNEPAYLPEVLHTLARLRDTDPQQLAATLLRNTLTLFNQITYAPE